MIDSFWNSGAAVAACMDVSALIRLLRNGHESSSMGPKVKKSAWGNDMIRYSIFNGTVTGCEG